MALKLVFLGPLEDAAGAGERSVPLGTSIDGVIAALEPSLAQVLSGPRIKLAVNGVILHGREGASLQDGDEIAFLPQVSGG